MSDNVSVPPERGVSQALARERRSGIQNLRYDLALVVPEQRAEPVQGRIVVRFVLSGSRRVVLDFSPPRECVHRLCVGGVDTPFELAQGHLIIPERATSAGENEVVVDFAAGDEALNRRDEYLYSLFVPARAQSAFPAFDQPDLKARFTLSLDVPEGWEAIGNAPAASVHTSGGRTRVQFAETAPLPTYLFAFAAGLFAVESATRDGRLLRVFHRETDPAVVARNRDAIFDLHASSLAWLEDYTAIAYPWRKLDVVLIPSFQFGGMEHAGCIAYNANSLLLDGSATLDQLLDRTSLIAHETSHMWFGDLVTMTWFDDVWLKEVFANYMAAKIVARQFPDVDHDVRFLLAHYPQAYQVDRTEGANPIRQPLANLRDAGQLYGPIIYRKAPIVMRQLEMVLGEQGLRDGLREYLRTYAYGNASWPDLVGILDARTSHDLAAWSAAWIEERGRPRLTVRRGSPGADGRASFTLTMTDPFGRGVVWPQQLHVALGYSDAVVHVPVSTEEPVTTVPCEPGRGSPRFVLPNGGGVAYGLFVLDPGSLDHLLRHLEDLPGAVTRGSAWVALWEMLLDGGVTASTFVDLVVRALPLEADEQVVQRVLHYLRRAFWHYLEPAERSARGATVEATLRQGLSETSEARLKSAWFTTLRDAMTTPAGVAWLERVWRREEEIPGLRLHEADEIGMAFELAVRDVPAAGDILALQRDRLVDPERRERFKFVVPALAADPAVREQAFERFRDAANRVREPWVLESMAYLNHPLREAHARRFVRPSLELLPEIERTGDIFFPSRWMNTTLGGHRSPEAAAVVRTFLRSTDCSERLRWTVLSAADELFRVTAPRGAGAEGAALERSRDARPVRPAP